MEGSSLLEAFAHDHDYAKPQLQPQTSHKIKTNQNNILQPINNKPALVSSCSLRRSDSRRNQPGIKIQRAQSYRKRVKSKSKSPARILARRSSILSTPCASPSPTFSSLSELSSSMRISSSRGVSESSTASSVFSDGDLNFDVDMAFEAILDLQENSDLTEHVKDYLSKNLDPVLSYVECPVWLTPSPGPGGRRSSNSTSDSGSWLSSSLESGGSRRRSSRSSSHGYFSSTETEMDDGDLLRDSDCYPPGISKLWNLSLDSEHIGNILFNTNSDSSNLSGDSFLKDKLFNVDDVFQQDFEDSKGSRIRCE